MAIKNNYIHTILGPIPAEALGPTDSHDHLFIGEGLAVRQKPDFLLDDFGRIAHDARLFKTAGGNGVIEMSPMDWGRDPEKMSRLAREIGIHVIAVTGFHKISYYPSAHWIYSDSEDALVDFVCAELRVGLRLPSWDMSRRLSEGCAGAIKVGTGKGCFNSTEEKLLRVAATAHRRTGAPIITHTDKGELALQQVEFLMAHGVQPHRIALSHVDRRPDFGFQKELASVGVFLEYDGLTRTDRGLDSVTQQLILKMLSAGYLDRVLLGGDLSRQRYWRGYGGKPGLDFLMGGFRKTLLQMGVPSDAVELMYTLN